MAADIFRRNDARNLLRHKKILLFGDSNMRAIYKDLTWLLEYGSILPSRALRKKNELSHANDLRISNGALTRSRDYVEIREYNHGILVRYEFITRLFLPQFIKVIENLTYEPDVLIINSCVWDLTRWGPNGVADYKTNVQKTMRFLKEKLSDRTRVIWTTTLPTSLKCRGGFLMENLSFMNNMLPFHIMAANSYMSERATKYNFDILDVHYQLRFLIDKRENHDGIHWSPLPMRYITNFLLTHLCLCWARTLPGNCKLDRNFKERSQKCVPISTDQQVRSLNSVAQVLTENSANRAQRSTSQGRGTQSYRNGKMISKRNKKHRKHHSSNTKKV